MSVVAQNRINTGMLHMMVMYPKITLETISVMTYCSETCFLVSVIGLRQSGHVVIEKSYAF